MLWIPMCRFGDNNISSRHVWYHKGTCSKQVRCHRFTLTGLFYIFYLKHTSNFSSYLLQSWDAYTYQDTTVVGILITSHPLIKKSWNPVQSMLKNNIEHVFQSSHVVHACSDNFNYRYLENAKQFLYANFSRMLWYHVLLSVKPFLSLQLNVWTILIISYVVSNMLAWGLVYKQLIPDMLLSL